jgi:hypothetical protein
MLLRPWIWLGSSEQGSHCFVSLDWAVCLLACALVGPTGQACQGFALYICHLVSEQEFGPAIYDLPPGSQH